MRFDTKLSNMTPAYREGYREIVESFDPKPVLAHFPDVAQHVIEPPLIWSFLADRVRSEIRVSEMAGK